jgi:hypothetical protein
MELINNPVTHALLNSDKSTHLLLVQEPWFDKIGTARQDNTRYGVDVQGGASSPEWELIYPVFAEGQCPKVMAYARKNTDQSHDTPHFTVVPRIDICTHPTIQVLDIILDKEQWHVINFYHNIQDNTSLQTLLALDIDATIPTLLIGDFNLHSQTWSTPDTPGSPKATCFEVWVATNLLSLANNPGEVMRRGPKHERDSVIDLAWYNEAAIQTATFTGLEVNWAGSLGSDHAMLCMTGHTHRVAAPDKGKDLGYVIDPEKGEEWKHTFSARSLPLQPHFHRPPTPEEVKKAAEALTEDIQHTNEEVFNKRHPPHPKASPWWTAACAIAT